MEFSTGKCIVVSADFVFRVLVTALEVPTFLLGMYCTQIMARKYRERQNATSLYLAGMFLFFGLFPLALLFDVVAVPEFLAIQYGYAVAMPVSAGANIFLLLFATEVFTSGRQAGADGQASGVTHRVQVIRALYAVAVLVTTIWGAGLKVAGESVTLVIGAYFLVTIGLYVVLFARAWRLANKLEDPVYRNATRYIALFAVVLLAVYVLFILDSFQDGYNPYSVVGWACFLGALYTAYSGFIKPGKRATRAAPTPENPAGQR